MSGAVNQVHQFGTIGNIGSAQVAIYAQVNTGTTVAGVAIWDDGQITPQQLGTLAADIIGLGTIAPQNLVGNGGTVAAAPSGVAISNDLTIVTQSGALELAIGATIARSNATLPAVLSSGTYTVSGTLSLAGFVHAPAGIDHSRTLTWSGAANYNNSNPTQAGISGYQSFSGSITGSGNGGTYLNALTILDYMDTHAIGGSIGFGIQHNVEGTGGASGFRTAAAFTLNVNGPTGNTGGEYVGLTAYAQGNGPDNGTTLAASGVLWGLNTVSHLTSTCTNWQGNVGYELDIATDAGANVIAQYGLHICTLSTHAVSGSSDDIAFHVSGDVGQTAFWKVGIGFGAALKPTAFNSASTLIKVFPDVTSGVLTVANFIDTTPASVTISGKLINAQGCTIDGQGNTDLNSLVIPGRTATIAAQGTITLTDAGKTVFMNVSTTAAQEVYLPAAPKGFWVDILDDTGVASPTYPVVINAPAGAMINTGSTIAIESPFGHARVFSNGTNYRFSS